MKDLGVSNLVKSGSAWLKYKTELMLATILWYGKDPRAWEIGRTRRVLERLGYQYGAKRQLSCQLGRSSREGQIGEQQRRITEQSSQEDGSPW